MRADFRATQTGEVAFSLLMAVISYAYQEPKQPGPDTENAETKPSSAISSAIPERKAVSASNGATDNEYYDREDLAAQRGMAALALLQVALGAVGLFLLARTLYYTRETLTEARDASEAARLGADHAKRNADAANEQAAVAAEALKESRRVFLFVDVVDVSIDKQTYPRATVRVRNLGGAPTVLVSGRAFLEHASLDGRRPPFPYRRDQYSLDNGAILTVESQPLVGNGGEFSCQVTMLKPLPEEERSARTLYLFGWIDYVEGPNEITLPFAFFYAEGVSDADETFIDINVSHFTVEPRREFSRRRQQQQSNE